MKVPFVSLNVMHQEIHTELTEAFQSVLNANNYIMGAEWDRFQKDLASLSQLDVEMVWTLYILF